MHDWMKWWVQQNSYFHCRVKSLICCWLASTSELNFANLLLRPLHEIYVYIHTLYSTSHTHTCWCPCVFVCRERETLSGVPTWKHVLKHKGTIRMLIHCQLHNVIKQTSAMYATPECCVNNVWEFESASVYTYQTNGLSSLMSLQYCAH